MPKEDDYQSQLQQARYQEGLEREAAERKKKRKLKKPEEVKFPLGMLIFAGLVDASDWAIGLLVIATGGFFLVIVLTILVVVKILAMITLYLWEKSKGIKRQDPLLRYLAGMLIEILPFFRWLPTNIALVLVWYFKEKALTQVPLAKGALKKAA